MKPVGPFGVGPVMDAEHTRAPGPDQRLRCRHIGGDHIILDQAL